MKPPDGKTDGEGVEAVVSAMVDRILEKGKIVHERS